MKASAPKNLKQLQKLAACAIRGPFDAHDRTPTAMKPIAESFIKPNDRLTSLERLEIYNRQYWFRLLDILYDDYPGLRAILGEGNFHQMSRAYLEKYPSRSFTLRNLGSRLGKFLEVQPQWAGQRQAMALDMFRFEWAQVEAFDGAALPIIDPQTVASADPTKLKLRLQPYLMLLDLAYPLDDFILAVKRQEGALRSEASNAVESPTKRRKKKPIPLPRKKKVWLAVHRYENQMYYKRLDPAAFAILANLQAGKSLAQSIEDVSKPVSPSKLGEWFNEWTQLGWLCKR